jgi:hypothetical protein
VISVSIHPAIFYQTDPLSKPEPPCVGSCFLHPAKPPVAAGVFLQRVKKLRLAESGHSVGVMTSSA